MYVVFLHAVAARRQVCSVQNIGRRSFDSATALHFVINVRIYYVHTFFNPLLSQTLCVNDKLDKVSIDKREKC